LQTVYLQHLGNNFWEIGIRKPTSFRVPKKIEGKNAAEKIS
jgi:hypothetical protein